MKKSSTKPKGATTYRQTAFGIISRSRLLTLEIEGTKKSLDFIAENYQKPITPELITSIHNIAFGWIFPDWAGKFRTIRVEYSGKEAVPPHQVPVLIANLCADLQERIIHLNQNDVHAVIALLSWFQHRFVWIHPCMPQMGVTTRS